MIGKESKRKKERKKVLEKVIELAVLCSSQLEGKQAGSLSALCDSSRRVIAT